MAADAKHIVGGAKHELREHPGFKDFLQKLLKDNIGMLAAFLSWSVLTSMVPIMVGIIAISSLFLRSPGVQRAVESHLSAALRGVIPPAQLHTLVTVSIHHAGLLSLIGLAGVLWGGSNVGGSLSTAFQAIFEVQGRNFIKEKLIDIGMIFVFTALMLVILLATTAGALLNRLFANFPLQGASQFLVGTAVGLVSAFILFAAIYVVFPNIKPPFRFHNVWLGSIVAAVLFQLLTYIWPLYSHFAHFSKYGALLGSLAVLTAWIYFFSMIVMIGAEIVAVQAIRQAQAEGRKVGPQPTESEPQHAVLRGKQQKQVGPGLVKETVPARGKQASEQRKSRPQAENSQREPSDGEVERDPAFWLWAAAPVVVGALAGIVQVVRGNEK